MKLPKELREKWEDRRLAEYQQKLKEANKILKMEGLWDTVELPDTEPEPDRIDINHYFLHKCKIYFPYDPPTIKTVLTSFKEDGWEEIWNDDQPEESLPTYEMKHDEYGVRCLIYFERDHPDATCVRKKIGTRVEKTRVDVWEVTCKEGAEEDVFEVETRDTEVENEETFL